jgi:hypothetical protein
MDLVSRAVAASVDVCDADRDAVVDVLRHLAVLARMVQAREVDCNLRLEALAVDQPGVNAEHLIAEATGRSVRAATRIVRRAGFARDVPAMKELLDLGLVSGEHLDSFAEAVRGLEEALRPALLAAQVELAQAARSMTVEQFRERLKAEVRRIEGDDGMSRLDRQKRQTGLKQWTGRDGMWRISGRYDPEQAMTLSQLLQAQTETRFRAPHPTHLALDPLLAHEWFQAMALADLMTGNGPGVGSFEVITVIDEHSWIHGRHGSSRVEFGRGIDLPIGAVRDLIESAAGRVRFVPVVIDCNGVVIRQGAPTASFEGLRASLERPVGLDRGRSRRFADRHQRRALRAMYRRCAIPGCERHISATEPHHIDHWERGGRTDLDRLLPLCKHHHDRLHAEQWHVQMGDDRSLVIRRDGAVIMTTGPPAEQWR